MKNAAQVLEYLKSSDDPAKSKEMHSYHKADRKYFGVANPVLDQISKDLRAELSLDDRIATADALWQSRGHEPRILAAKLLTQARLRPDDTAAWNTIASWVKDFDAWAIADHACIAGQKRVVWDPSRLDQVAEWTKSDHMWTRRAALVITLPWTKQNNPKPDEELARDRILGWAASYTTDHDWFIQKAIGWWLRELSKHDAPRVLHFIDTHGEAMKPFARKEALRKISPTQ
jgi:3-methyladenine DNA glycosylase AlkD